MMFGTMLGPLVILSYHPQLQMENKDPYSLVVWYRASFVLKTLHLELWMIGEDDQGDPTWFQASLLVIWSNFCFTNILVCWLFLGQDWRGPYAPFGVVNDRRG